VQFTFIKIRRQSSAARRVVNSMTDSDRRCAFQPAHEGLGLVDGQILDTISRTGGLDLAKVARRGSCSVCSMIFEAGIRFQPDLAQDDALITCDMKRIPGRAARVYVHINTPPGTDLELYTLKGM